MSTLSTAPTATPAAADDLLASFTDLSARDDESGMAVPLDNRADEEDDHSSLFSGDEEDPADVHYKGLLPTYKAIIHQAVTGGSSWISEAVYGLHFTRVFDYMRNHRYRDRQGGTFEAIVFGEVAGHGTNFSAKGNHYSPPGQSLPLADGSKAKHTLVLRCPTHATPELKALFRNQLVGMNTVVESEEKEDRSAKISPTIKEWVISSPTGDDDDDMITCMSNVIYKVPSDTPQTGGGGKPKRALARTAIGSSSSPSTSGPAEGSPGEAAPGGSAGDGIERQPVVGELLDPKVFPDYTGAPAFGLVHGKAVQQDYRRRDNSLIPCGTTASVVREGALVLAKMSLHAFNIPDPKNGHGKRIYQANIETIRVLAESPMPYIIQDSADSPMAPRTGHAKRTADALANFDLDFKEEATAVEEPPKKKAKSKPPKASPAAPAKSSFNGPTTLPPASSNVPPTTIAAGFAQEDDVDMEDEANGEPEVLVEGADGEASISGDVGPAEAPEDIGNAKRGRKGKARK